jgi:hypothetical protein
MRFSWKKQKRTQGLDQIPAISGDNGKNNGGLMIGVEKGFSEAFMFIFSVVLHLSHSLEGEHSVR